MTFLAAALTHCRLQQIMARVIPGAKPVAATLVAAFLFLGVSAASIRADGPADCGIMPGISIPASDSDFGGGDRILRSTRSDNSNCELHISIVREADPVGPVLTPCVVTVTPRQVTGRGTAGTVSADGDCGSLFLDWSVNVQAPAVQSQPDSGGASASGESSTTAYGKITGDDALGFDVFWHYSKVTWSHNESEVLSATQYTDGWKRAHWVLISKSNNITKINSTKYEAWSKRDYMTTTIPAGNVTTVTLHARLDGLFNCTYSSKPYHLWNTFGLDLDYECKEGSP